MADGAQPGHITGVIFDYGRVLAWTQHQEPRAAWERRLGLAPGALTRAVHNEHSWIAAQRGTITIDAHWQEVSTALGLTTEDTTALRAAFYAGDVLNGELVACPGHGPGRPAEPALAGSAWFLALGPAE